MILVKIFLSRHSNVNGRPNPRTSCGVKMADVEVVLAEQQNERVSYLVLQYIKHGVTSTSLHN